MASFWLLHKVCAVLQPVHTWFLDITAFILNVGMLIRMYECVKEFGYVRLNVLLYCFCLAIHIIYEQCNIPGL